MHCGKTLTNTGLTANKWFSPFSQPTVANVFYCLFHRGKNPDEPDRRQVGADLLGEASNLALLHHAAESDTAHWQF